MSWPEGQGTSLATDGAHRHLLSMYVVTEADAAAIREAYETGGELSAALEPVRRRFPGIIGQRHSQGQGSL